MQVWHTGQNERLYKKQAGNQNERDEAKSKRVAQNIILQLTNGGSEETGREDKSWSRRHEGAAPTVETRQKYLGHGATAARPGPCIRATAPRSELG